MEDNYSHIDNSVIYIIENVPGPTDHSEEHNSIVDSFNAQLIDKCNCLNKCKPDLCCCIVKSGGNNYISCSISTKIKLCKEKMRDDGIINPIIECNDLCSCSVDCNNRLVQKGPIKSLYVKSCANHKGLGLFSMDAIFKHTFICEYAGEVLTKAQAENRHQFNISNNKMNYIFCLNEHSDDRVVQTIVDPSELGNIGRYANHSCDPNCVIVPVRVNTPIPKLALFSCTDILPGEEITFHYGSSSSANLMPANGVRTKCLCNTAKCTGWMPYQSLC